ITLTKSKHIISRPFSHTRVWPYPNGSKNHERFFISRCGDFESRGNTPCDKFPRMKIDRRNFLLTSSALLLTSSQTSFASDRSSPVVPESDHLDPAPAKGKQVSVYTTADK